MDERGLYEVADPSSLFLVKRKDAIPPGITAVPYTKEPGFND